jgi:hypothetical protein
VPLDALGKILFRSAAYDAPRFHPGVMQIHSTLPRDRLTW